MIITAKKIRMERKKESIQNHNLNTLLKILQVQY